MNRITKLLNIKYPIIQAGMVWCSGWRLASASSNNGALGVLGAGSMYPDVLREHIIKCKAATNKPFAVNIPLFYPQIEALFDILFEENIKIVITSGGNPELYTKRMKDAGMTVIHVVANVKFAQKAENAGVCIVLVTDLMNSPPPPKILNLMPYISNILSTIVSFMNIVSHILSAS